MRFMDQEAIYNIPEDRRIEYVEVVVDYIPYKEDQNMVRITAGGNLIYYPGELMTRTAKLKARKSYGTALFLPRGQGQDACVWVPKTFTWLLCYPNGETGIHMHQCTII